MQKVDTGKIYAMKSLKKSEMFKKDQVGDRVNQPVVRALADDPSEPSARPCQSRTRCLGGIKLALGRSIILLVPRFKLSVPADGILTWR